MVISTIFSKADRKIKAYVDASENGGISKIPTSVGWKNKEMEKLPLMNLN